MSADGRKPLVYVAGPISGDPFGCVRQSLAAFDWLRDAGCIPFCPQWSVLPEMVSGHDYETWMTYDFDMIRRCDALLRLDGVSPGADREVELAKSLGIPVLADGDVMAVGLFVEAWPPVAVVRADQQGATDLVRAFLLDEFPDGECHYTHAQRIEIVDGKRMATGEFPPDPDCLYCRAVELLAARSGADREWDGDEAVPPWADGDMPDTDTYLESELFVAGALSTLPPFTTFHPAWCLPFARQALGALGEWEPTDAASPAAAPSGADQQEPDGQVCDDCGEAFAGDEHFHVGEPYEGCDADKMGWHVRGSESDLVAEACDESMARRIVTALNRAAAAPSTPGAPEGSASISGVDVASMEPAEVTMTQSDGSTRRVTRVPLREEFPIGPDDPESAPPPAVQGAPGGER